MQLRQVQIAVIYFSGLLQGTTIVLLLAAGPILTDSAFHDFSLSQFGLLTVPQIVLAIAASFAAAKWARNFGMKRVLWLGLLSNLLAMGFFATSQWLIEMPFFSFGMLLVSRAAIGAGFGLTLTALNAYAFKLFPEREDAAVTALHVFTGIGQFSAPLLFGIFLELGFWWGAPTLMGVSLALMLLLLLKLPLEFLDEDSDSTSEVKLKKLSLRIWFFASVSLIYGMIEGTIGNWTPIYLGESVHLSKADAGLGLSLVWASVTVARVAFAFFSIRFNPKPLYYLAPFVVGGLFTVWPTLQGMAANYTLMIVIGLAISFYFPYLISLSSSESPTQSVAISGVLVAAFQLGIGLGSNGIGLAADTIELGTLLQWFGVWPVVMGLIALYLGWSAPNHKGNGINRRLPCLILPCVQQHEKKEASS